MNYYKKTRKVFGIKHAGDVEKAVLKFLYKRRNENYLYYVKTISQAVNMDTDSVRGALNRLYERRYVKKDWDDEDRRYTLWRIRRNRNVFRIVEQRIGIQKKPKRKPIDRTQIPNKSDYVEKISETAIKFRPLKTALQLAFPKAALPMEMGYRVLTNLNTIRNMYDTYDGESSFQLRNVLNDTVSDATKFTFTQLANYSLQPVKGEVVSTIVESSSEYLEKKEVFKDLTDALQLDESHSRFFKMFYQNSLKNYLNQKLVETESEG
ncbi:MAG TPA: hypothetical protein ENH23_04935 [candidate division Zixibacteria bacterium]|nr:hypothetical protein [candidate division Zixibacteria bacterium]